MARLFCPRHFVESPKNHYFSLLSSALRSPNISFIVAVLAVSTSFWISLMSSTVAVSGTGDKISSIYNCTGFVRPLQGRRMVCAAVRGLQPSIVQWFCNMLSIENRRVSWQNKNNGSSLKVPVPHPAVGDDPMKLFHAQMVPELLSQFQRIFPPPPGPSVVADPRTARLRALVSATGPFPGPADQFPVVSARAGRDGPTLRSSAPDQPAQHVVLCPAPAVVFATGPGAAEYPSRTPSPQARPTVGAGFDAADVAFVSAPRLPPDQRHDRRWGGCCGNS